MAQSNTVAVLANGTVASLDADHNQLVILGPDGAVQQRIPVGNRPAQLTVDGDTVAVTNRADRTVSIVNGVSGAVRTVPVGVEPYGVAFVDKDQLAITLFAENRLALVDTALGQVVRTVELPNGGGARGVATLPNHKVFVSHLLGDALTAVDLNHASVDTVPIRVSVGGAPLNPSLVGSLTVSPDQSRVSTAHVQLNNEGLRPNANQGGSGYLGTPEQMPAITPAVTTVDAHSNTMLSNTSAADTPVGTVTDCPDCGSTRTAPSATGDASSALLSTTNGSIPDGRQLNEPVQLAFLDGGRGLAVLARGSHNVFIWRLDTQGNRRDLLQVSTVGAGCDGMAVTADGKQLLVHNAFDLTLSVVDLPDLDFGTDQRGNAFLGKTAQRRPIPPTQDVDPRATWTLAQVTLPPDEAQGRRLFHDATLPGMTKGQGITCATCHADGRNDNKTWMFIDGPRNTPSLAAFAQGRPGLATATAPLHWKGELATHMDLQRTVTEFMGGTGLDPTQLNQLAAFIDTIPEPDNAFRDDANAFALQARGQELFFSPAVGCTACHSGPHFTDNLNHDVETDSEGTRQDGQVIAAGFQTPVLHGLAASAPYGHDGRYPTLEDLLLDLVRGGKMKLPTQDARPLAQLSDGDLAALAAYLRTL